MQIWFIVSLLFSVIVAIFAVLNSSIISINLVFQSFEMSQSIVILVSAALGAIIVLFLGLFSKIKSSLRIRELSNDLRDAEKKNELLTNSIKAYEAKESAGKSLETKEAGGKASQIKTDSQVE